MQDEKNTKLLKHRHYLSHSKVYRARQNMHTRCSNERHEKYRYYGGRGIRVCDRWKSFAAFLEDMGHPKRKDLSLDRIDGNGNYEPKNCRWVTLSVQQKNRRKWGKKNICVSA